MSKLWEQTRAFFLNDLWTRDILSLGKAKAFFIQTLRFLAVIIADIVTGPLILRATSLVYTTLLSLVPLLAVSFSVLKAFGVHNAALPLLTNLLAPMGPKGVELSNTIIEFVNNMKVGVLGSVGLVILLYTVVSLVQQVEDSFNSLWRVRGPRSLLMRISYYLSSVLIGPVLIASAIGFTATIVSSAIMQRLLVIEPIGTLVYYTGKLIPSVVVCLAFAMAYLLVPNTKVQVKAALVGGVVGGLLWQTMNWIFSSFVVTTSHYSAVYSGFAVVILFMIWIFVSWLVLLIGAEVSFYYQNPRLLVIGNASRAPDARHFERLAVSIMYLVGDHFIRDKEPWNEYTLASRLGLGVEPVADIVDVLEKKGILVETATDPPAYLPARALESVLLRDVYDAVRHSSPDEGLRRPRIASIAEVDLLEERIDDAISNSLGERTLRDLVRSNPEM